MTLSFLFFHCQTLFYIFFNSIYLRKFWIILYKPEKKIKEIKVMFGFKYQKNKKNFINKIIFSYLIIL